jgi:hypothetical protein
MGVQHDIQLFVDEVLHRVDLIIKDALEFSAASMSVDPSQDHLFTSIDIPCNDNLGIFDTGFWIIHPRRQFRNRQSVLGYIVTLGTKVTLVAQEAGSHHTFDDSLQIAVDEPPHVFQTILKQLLHFEVDHRRAHCTAFGIAQSLKFHECCGFHLQGVDIRRSSASVANHESLALRHAGPQCVDSCCLRFGEGDVRAFVRPTAETSKSDLLFNLFDQAGVSPGLAHISNAQVLSIGFTYRWNAEDELNTLPLKLPERISQKPERVITNRSQIISIPLACRLMGRVAGRAIVHGIEVQLEEVVRILVVVVGVAKEPPIFQPATPHVVCDRRLVLVVVFTGRFARPFLDVLRIWPVWPIAVRDRFCMSGLAFVSNCEPYSPVQVMPKSMPTMKSGCHASVDIVQEVSRNTLHWLLDIQICRRDTAAETPLCQKKLDGWGESKYQKAQTSA